MQTRNESRQNTREARQPPMLANKVCLHRAYIGVDFQKHLSSNTVVFIPSDSNNLEDNPLTHTGILVKRRKRTCAKHVFHQLVVFVCARTKTPHVRTSTPVHASDQHASSTAYVPHECV